MPKILITGNGFDLNLGLPTSFIDFINILNSLNKSSEITFNSIYSNSSNYNMITERYSAFTFDIDKIETLRCNIQNNVWFLFFHGELEIETWIDFENRIEYVLNSLFKSVKYIQSNIFSKGSLSKDYIVYRPELFNYDIEIIQVLRRFGIINLEKNGDLVLNTHFLVDKYDHFIDLDLNKITQTLIDELGKFKKIFALYFEVFVYPLYDKLNSSDKRNF